MNQLSTGAFNELFRSELLRLFQLRRDVRHFRTDPISSDQLHRLVRAARLAPSVGLSEPWRLVSVASKEMRALVSSEFEASNREAAKGYSSEVRDQYSQLKLAGLQEAPVHLAVFVDSQTTQGRGLGHQTMPESLEYSVVAAIQNFWLAARAEGIGVGWVSIFRPDRVTAILQCPSEWRLVAYLCIGYPIEDHETPELERLGWEHRDKKEEAWLIR